MFSWTNVSQKQHLEFGMSQVNVIAFWKLVSWPQSVATSQIHDQQVPVQTLIQTISQKMSKKPDKKNQKTLLNKNKPCPPFSPPPQYLRSVFLQNTSTPQLLHRLSSGLVSVCSMCWYGWLLGVRGCFKTHSEQNVSHKYSMTHSCRTWSFSLDGSISAVWVLECTFTQALSSNTIF